ncbi:MULTISPECIES: Fe(3+) dicitrate ABC transporter ATP-binding protein FecE [Pseudomonas syringae group]|jgi:ABC-type cobalamin/Fe3+-siderophores transport systems, ATPase components|uniref:Fe(3+) dicitrate ABC transporter ATP-binding protein FecE n=3 Tax=Pseudomonas syringae group TaxID=136849 RepID=A0AA46VTR9_PSEVI|nr:MULTISPECIES: Fe(3+) dicitrate ABC transporter ATP-binding protein FecE [Pseudomonas syringae group]MBD8808778.1 Fe(3+) dicitrate ABC transporter ATP-binding protein FecE [Pseudomonas syringae]KIQ33122.1 iron ABC transporter [Pseudomonas viridiflava]KPL62868.1 iron ABC transporter [Pseudomonas viridiflava]KPY42627.1 Ferrichrome ABC transporter PvuE [Pseudomonas syringae pv. ribicola]KPZ27871.1 Ferrichrome ABC transporter PvuE [Pseudomonas viridiflava]
MSILQAQQLDIGYGATRIVQDLSFSPPPGKVTALIGPNGCGKSTLLKAFARILTPQAGSLSLDGKAYRDLSARDLARKVAFLPQVLPIPEGVSVRQLVAYGRSPHNSLWGRLSGADQHSVEQALQRMELETLADRPLSDLSGGQRQRAWLAMILAQDAAIVLLDEPTTYLDISHQVELLDLMRALSAEGKTVITVLHDINQACRYADHLAVMQAGRLVASGTPGDVLNAELVCRVFDVQVQIMREPVAGTPMCIVERSTRCTS